MKLISGQRFYLKEENQFVWAISGKLEVYAVTRSGGSFRQQFLVELTAGGAAFPSLDEFGYIDFLVYAVEDSEIVLVEIDSVSTNELRLLLLNWFSALVELPWLRLMADLGDDVLKAWRARAIFLSDDLDAEDFKAEFVDNEQILSMLLGIKFRSEDEKLSRRIEQSEENKRHMFDETVAKLSGKDLAIYSDSADGSAGTDTSVNEITFIVKRIAVALKMPTTGISIPPEVAKKLDQIGVIRRLVQKGNM